VIYLSISVSGLTDIFTGWPVPECLHSGFIGAKDDGDDGDNRNYYTCKALVKSSPLTNQHPTFFTGRMSSCRPTNSVKALKRRYV